MLKYTIIIVMICLIFMTACQDNVRNIQTDEADLTTKSETIENETIEYDIIELNLDIPFNPNFMESEDSSFILNNGYIVIRKFESVRKGNFYYRQYIYDIDGHRIHPERDSKKYYTNYFRVILETDLGNIIVTDNHGETTLLDSEWNEIDTQNELTFYHAYPLDNGRYFAINDEYMLEYGYAPSGFEEEPEVRYALYRYTEKITDCIFSKIIPCEDGFVCYYADSVLPGESITIKVDDTIKDDADDFSVYYDSNEDKYYCINNAGEKIFDQSFDYISKPSNNLSIAYIDNLIYLIQPSDTTAQ